jgi:hypothetical protein
LKKSKLRLSFPEDEKLHIWLPLLLNAYSIMDEGVKKDIEELEKKGRKLSLRKVFCNSY